MPAQQRSYITTAFLSGSTGPVAIGTVLVNNGTRYVVATTANRTSYGRAECVALSAGDDDDVNIEVQHAGTIPASITGLAAGSASWVRVSSTGTLERVTPGSGDDIIGKCNAAGDLFIQPGTWDSNNYAGGGGGGGDASYPIDLEDSGEVTGELLHEHGGLEADVSAYSGLVKIDAGATSAVALPLAYGNGGTGLSALGTALQVLRTNAGATAIEWATASVAVGSVTGLGTGVATWLATPSGANLATALTTALPNTKGGTGQDSSGWTGLASVSSGTWSALTLGSGVATFLGTPSGANLASALTTALPDTKGGTGLTSLGSGVATFLGTPSSANLRTAVSDETGSGALVFGTAPTLSSPVLAGTPQYTGTRGNIRSVVSEVQTSSTSQTTCGSVTMSDETLCAFDVIVTCARRTNVSKGGRYKRSVVYRRTSGGAPTIVGSLESGTDQETTAGDDVTIDVSSNDVRVRVTAADSDGRNWFSEIRVQETLAT